VLGLCVVDQFRRGERGMVAGCGCRGGAQGERYLRGLDGVKEDKGYGCTGKQPGAMRRI